MTARPSRFQHIAVGNEASFAESSPTYDFALEAIEKVDVSGLRRESIDAGFTGQYGTEGYRMLRGPKEGTFSVTLYLAGHGTDPGAGALTMTDLATLLQYCLGSSYSAGDGGTCDGGGTATSFDVTGASVGAYSGWLVGALGDGRGDGQCMIAESESAGTVTAYTGLAATPNAADGFRPMISLHPYEDPSNFVNITSTAWRILTGNEQYACHGCICTGFTLDNVVHRQRPTVTLTFRAAKWENVNVTWPATTPAKDAKDPAPVMEGSFYFSSSSTRAAYNVRSFGVSFDHTVFIEESTSSSDADRVITGAKYGPTRASVNMVLDSEVVGTTTFKDDYEADNNMRMVYTLSSDPGKAVAIFCPNLKWDSEPVQNETNGLNTVECSLTAEANTSVTTSDRTLANFQILLG